MNKKAWLLILPATLLVLYLLGPSPEEPVYNEAIPAFPQSPAQLEMTVKAQEAKHKIKPDNEARIVWSNEAKEKTDYAIVYLHGFSASQAEGEPVHRNIANKFGCNLYLSRLAEHGIDTTEQLVNLTADKYWESAKEAYAIGKQLGKKVILMGTSTGGTLALLLAARYPEIAGVVLLSPNIEINDGSAWILNNPWGLQLARFIVSSDYIKSEDDRDLHKKYWNYPYRLEAAVALQELIETAMTEETFQEVRQPLLLLYYYKDEKNQDDVVKVEAMHEMFRQVSTPPSQKVSVALPTTGHHVLGSYIKSKDVAAVESQIEQFLRKQLNLRGR